MFSQRVGLGPETEGISQLARQTLRLDSPTHHGRDLDLTADHFEFQHKEELGRAKAVPISRVVDCPDSGNICPGNGPCPKPPARFDLVSVNDHTDGETPERKQYRDGDEQHTRPERSFDGPIDGVVNPAQRGGREQEQKRA